MTLGNSLMPLVGAWWLATGLAAEIAADDHLAGAALAAGTKWETRYHVLEGARPGPTVLLVAGMHGNEPAGSRAAEQILSWSLRRGRLVVVPRANRVGLKRGTRELPFEAEGRRNLNRNFPGPEAGAPRGQLAVSLWELAVRERPQWVVDLHEGYEFRRRQSSSDGSSVVHARSEESRRMAERLVRAVNESIEARDRRFVLFSPPIDGGLARAASRLLDCEALILETTTRNQPLSLRTRQHRILVHRLLSELDMVESGVNTLLPPGRGPGDEVRVAIYDGGGSSVSCVRRVEQLTERGEGMLPVRVGGDDIRAGVLRNFDVVLFGGGRGSRMARALGPEGRASLRDFVHGGGGYVGLSAGGYLATLGYSWSLGLLDVRVVDREHWRRGAGRVIIELTREGREALPSSSAREDVLYVNGPLFGPAGDDSLEDSLTLARFRQGVEGLDSAEEMIGRPALVAGRYGDGRAVASSVRLERTKGLGKLLAQVVLWAAGRAEQLPDEARRS